MKENSGKNVCGCWKSDTKIIGKITFRVNAYSINAEEGKWSIQGNEIWLIDKDLKNGMKWFFKFEDLNKKMCQRYNFKYLDLQHKYLEL